MKKSIIGYSTLALALLYSMEEVRAQQGFGTDKPSKASAIEMKSSSKGLLIPRVALKALNDFDPIKGAVATAPETNSLLVYNTKLDVAASLSPGYYYWTVADQKWNRLAASAELTLAGDVNGGLGTNTINKIQGQTVSLGAQGSLTANQVLAWNGSAWVPSTPTVATDNVTNAKDVSVGSDKVILGGTPVGAALKAFSIDVDETKLNLANIGGTLPTNKIVAGTDGQVLVTDGTTVKWDSKNALITGVSNSSVVNSLTTTVNGVTGTAVDIINSNALTLNATNELVSTINGEAATLDISPAVRANQEKTVVAAGTGVTVSAGAPVGNTTTYTVAADLANISLAGDVSGAANNTKVEKLQGVPVSSTAPTTNGEVLTWNGTAWAPATPTVSATNVTGGKDLTAGDGSIVVTTGTGATLVDANVKVAQGGILNSHIENGAISENKLADEAVTSLKIADGTIDGVDIKDGAITTSELADKNVTAGKLIALPTEAGKVGVVQPDGSVVYENISSANVDGKALVVGDGLEIYAGSGAGALLVDASVRIKDGGINTIKIEDKNVTTAKIADGAVNTLQVAVDAITTAKIADANVTPNKIQPAQGTITERQVLVTQTDGSVVWVSEDVISPTTTNTLSSATNTMTSNVNGVSDDALIINSLSNSLAGTTLTTSVNAVDGSIDLAPAIKDGQKVDTFTGTAPISFVAAAAANTSGGKDYTVAVSNATSGAVGVVKPGTGLSVLADGTLNAAASTLSVTNTVAGGHKIADVAVDGGTAVAINETVTTLSQDATGVKYINENGGTGVTAKVVSADANNLVTTGTDHGAFISAATIASNSKSTVVASGTNTTVPAASVVGNVTTYQVDVATATNTGNLGLVKQAATNPTVNVAADGTLSVNTGTSGIGKTLTGSGITINGNASESDAVLKAVTLGIADNAINSAKIADGTITASDIATPGNNKVLTSNTTGAPTWVDQSALVPTITHTLGVTGNTLTSTVNTISPTATIINGFGNTLSGTTLTTAANGLTAPIDLAPAIKAGETLTTLSQDAATGVISYKNESTAAAVTANLLGATGGNLLTVDGNGGLLLTSANVTANQEKTVVAQGTGITVTAGTPVGNTTTYTVAANPAGITLTGDVNGLASANKVEKIQTIPVSATAPTANQVLSYNGTAWAPTALPTSVASLAVTAPIKNTGTATAPIIAVDNATSSTVGVVKPGTGLSVTTDGTLNAAASTLAVTNTVTGRKIADISVDGGTAVPINETVTNLAQSTTTGIITYTKEDATIATANLRGATGGNLLTVDGNGGLLLTSANVTGNQEKTVVASGTNTTVPAATVVGNVSTYQVNVATATNSVLGVASAGTGLTATNGVFAVNPSAITTGKNITTTNGAISITGGSNATFTDVTLAVKANNGLTVASDNVQLGGTLTNTNTTIVTNGATNKLNITGLEAGATTDAIVLSSTGGQLKTISTANLVQEPWNVQTTNGTSVKATANGENIYQVGKVTIGTAVTAALGTQAGLASLYVKGKTASVGTTINPAVYVDGDVEITGKYYSPSSVFADYVFEKYFTGTSKINAKYNFTPLSDVKSFVAKNHHLPGVTSINQVQKTANGYKIDLTEMSMQQLEKIEELYLHVIEQQEQIDSKDKEIETLKAKQASLEERMSKLEKLLGDK